MNRRHAVRFFVGTSLMCGGCNAILGNEPGQLQTTTTSTTGPGAGSGGDDHPHYLFVIGGETPTGELMDDVSASLIGPDGSLGPWFASGKLDPPRSGHASTAQSNRLYVFSGQTPAFTTQVDWATPGSDGLTKWFPGLSLPVGRFRTASASIDGKLFVVAGYSNNTVEEPLYLRDVQVASITEGGANSTWSQFGELPTTRHRHTAVAYQDHLYVLGGSRDAEADGNYLDDVLSAPIDGATGEFETEASHFSPARFELCSVVAKQHLFVIGGQFPAGFTDEVQSARINQDGHLDGFLPVLALPEQLHGHACATYGDVIYVIEAGISTEELGNVYSGVVNDDGQVEKWNAEVPLPAPRGFFTATVL